MTIKQIMKSHSRSTRKRSRTTTSLTARVDSAHTERHHTQKWSADVMEHSDALTLENNIFTRSASAIATSLKQSAERSHRPKSSPFRSAMSMLNFYVNRAGKNLSPARRKKLQAAKTALRKAFGRPA